MRGVSGGERKRVSVAEALVSNARLVCLDEISTGLDASITFDIVSCIAAWAHTVRSTVVISLQQPTPEVSGLFDEVLLLREGATVYHGPRDGLRGYWAKLGFSPPQKMSLADVREAAAAGHAQKDLFDWLIDMLTSPTTVARRDAKGGAELPAGLPRAPSSRLNPSCALSSAPAETCPLLQPGDVSLLQERAALGGGTASSVQTSSKHASSSNWARDGGTRQRSRGSGGSASSSCIASRCPPPTLGAARRRCDRERSTLPSGQYK